MYCSVPLELQKPNHMCQRGPKQYRRSLCRPGRCRLLVAPLLLPSPHPGGLAARAEQEAADRLAEKGVRGNPRNMKPNSKLYSLISFLIKKFKIEKTTKYKSFSDAFHYHRTRHL